MHLSAQTMLPHRNTNYAPTVLNNPCSLMMFEGLNVIRADDGRIPFAYPR